MNNRYRVSFILKDIGELLEEQEEIKSIKKILIEEISTYDFEINDLEVYPI